MAFQNEAVFDFRNISQSKMAMSGFHWVNSAQRYWRPVMSCLSWWAQSGRRWAGSLGGTRDATKKRGRKILTVTQSEKCNINSLNKMLGCSEDWEINSAWGEASLGCQHQRKWKKKINALIFWKPFTLPSRNIRKGNGQKTLIFWKRCLVT